MMTRLIAEQRRRQSHAARSQPAVQHRRAAQCTAHARAAILYTPTTRGESRASDLVPREWGDDARTARYLQRCLSLLPARATTEDSNRLAAAFFALAALDRLAVTPRPRVLQSGSEENLAAVEWILSLQCGTGGFRGGTSAGDDGVEGAHLVLSLFAALSLGVLRAPRTCFNRVDVDGLLSFVGQCQRDDGRSVCRALTKR